LEEISHIGAIDTVRVLANEERLRLLRLLMRGPATLTKGYVEKFYCATARAYAVDFMVLPDEGERGLLVILGSDDLALDLVARRLREESTGPDVITMAMGSLEGLIALRHGVGHMAGCHLFDAESGDFNRSYARALFPGRALMLITLAHRQQGLIVPAGNPRGLKDLAGAVSAGARLMNRNRGSGTRVWLDRLLAVGAVDPVRVAGYEDEVMTHDAAARAVAEAPPTWPSASSRQRTPTASASSLWSRSATTSSPRASTTRASCSRHCWLC
jgi:hypothetical protein